jgi:hypothetical protein
MYLSPHALADALGGISQLIEYYDITTRDTREAVAACIDAACQDHGVSVGKGEPGQRFTFSADVGALAGLLLDACPVYRADRVKPVTPTIGTLQVLFRGGVAA